MVKTTPASQGFLDALVKTLPKKVRDPHGKSLFDKGVPTSASGMERTERTLLLIQAWNNAYGRSSKYPQFAKAYMQLVTKGCRFPQPREEENAPIHTPDVNPQRKKSSAATQLAQEGYKDQECAAAYESAVLLMDMLTASAPGTDLKKDELVQTLVAAVRNAQNMCMNIIMQGQANEDVLSEVLRVNDDLLMALQYYKSLRSGGPREHPLAKRREQEAKEKRDSEAAAAAAEKKKKKKSKPQKLESLDLKKAKSKKKSKKKKESSSESSSSSSSENEDDEEPAPQLKQQISAGTSDLLDMFSGAAGGGGGGQAAAAATPSKAPSKEKKPKRSGAAGGFLLAPPPDEEITVTTRRGRASDAGKPAAKVAKANGGGLDDLFAMPAAAPAAAPAPAPAADDDDPFGAMFDELAMRSADPSKQESKPAASAEWDPFA